MLRVLIIDDDYWVRCGMRKTIPWEEYGFTIVGEAADGVEGLELYKNLRPEIVITDIKMENGNGLELIKNIRALGGNTDIIILSGYKEFEYAQQAIVYGVKFYLLKPIKNDDLIGALLSVRDGRPAESSAAEAARGASVAVGGFSNDEISKAASSIRKVDYDATISIIDKYFAQIDETANINIPVLQTNILEFVILITHSVLGSKAKREQIFGADFNPAHEIQKLATCSALHDFTVKFINKIYENPNLVLDYTYRPEIQQAIAIIMFRYKEPLTVSDVAAELFISSSYLMYLFKKETGKTFNTFLTEYRINTAIELIKLGKYKIYEISEMVGYKNPAYFIKQFKRTTGKAPKYYHSASAADNAFE